MMSEKSQFQKVTYCKSIFIWPIQMKRQSLVKGSKSVVAKADGWEESVTVKE